MQGDYSRKNWAEADGILLGCITLQNENIHGIYFIYLAKNDHIHGVNNISYH